MRALTKLLAVLLASSLRPLSRAPHNRSHQRTDTLRRRLLTSRHAMALGISARHQRLHSQDDARQLRAHRKYPNYIFNFSGANRYRMMKEYWPADYARVKQYVAAGRWFPAGSSMEESDVNVPSAESIFRQILYGNRFFQREFGKTSAEYMLPDCFGFPASSAEHSRACRFERFLNTKTHLEFSCACRWSRFDSGNTTRNSVECRLLGRDRMVVELSRH